MGLRTRVLTVNPLVGQNNDLRYKSSLPLCMEETRIRLYKSQSRVNLRTRAAISFRSWTDCDSKSPASHCACWINKQQVPPKLSSLLLLQLQHNYLFSVCLGEYNLIISRSFRQCIYLCWHLDAAVNMPSEMIDWCYFVQFSISCKWQPALRIRLLGKINMLFYEIVHTIS